MPRLYDRAESIFLDYSLIIKGKSCARHGNYRSTKAQSSKYKSKDCTKPKSSKLKVLDGWEAGMLGGQKAKT
jgi:hypothetical protein